VIEREWREASDMRTSTVTLAAILTVAAVLRFWSLGAGIPFNVGVDEPQIMNRSLQMVKAGTLNPGGFYDYPGLYLYVQMGVICARFLAGGTAAEWRTLNEVSADDFYLWGRAVTAALGVLTVLVVYHVGMRWGARHAMLAAALMAVIPSHVRESHYVLTDVPVTFFVALAFLLTLRAHERARAASFAAAGAAAGLAAATKYPGGLALVLPLVAVWMTPDTRPSRVVGSLAAVGACAGAFLLAAPYTVLDLPGFLNAYATLAAGYAGSPPPEPAWLIYLKHLRGNFWWPALLLAAGGLVMGVVRAIRGPGRVRWTLAILFPILFFWSVSGQTLIFMRYILPIVPFLCVLAAAATVSGVSLLRRFEIPRAVRTALIIGLTVAAILPPGIRAVAFNRHISRYWTQARAYDWIVANLPPGTSIAIEANTPVLPPGRYKVTHVGQLRERSYEDYRDQGVEYFVSTSQVTDPFLKSPQQYPRQYADYRRLFGQSREVVRFPTTGESPGPELVIYKVRP
jgi:4-amino-4-deoxy-L-arabinose transferase-like glycosyltransferase